MFRTVRIVSFAIFLAGTPALGIEVDQHGELLWRFVSEPYAANYDSDGIPLSLSPTPSAFSSAFWQQLAVALPEYRDVRQTNPDYIADDEGANLRLSGEAEVWVTFAHDAAGYRNSLGFFTFDDGSVPQSRTEISEKIIFPNASYAGAGGGSRGLHSGDTVYLGRFPAGTRVGFALAANGFNGTTGVSTVMNPDDIYYTLSALNAEADPSLRAHNVLLYDAASQRVVLGFEDMLRTSRACDHDFNDVLFTVTTNPTGAIDASALRPLPQPVDRDRDGILDGNDDFPDDPTRAFRTYNPSSATMGTLAFEDRWPLQGDYDMNDLVLNYRVEQVVNAGGQIRDINVHYELAARGAMFGNGFGVQIQALDPRLIEAATLQTDTDPPVAVQSEAKQDAATFIIFQNATNHSPTPTGCKFFNTEPRCERGKGSTFDLRVTLRQAVSPDTIGRAPFNPFVFRSGRRGLEIHLPDHAPTALADRKLLGTSDDTSDPTRNRYYRTENNLPFALDLPTGWAYPTEGTPIVNAYHRFASWAASGGDTDSDWYVIPPAPRTTY